jgi:hypothetical protein
MFLVPKQGVNQWWLVIDLRQLTIYCSEFTMTCKTLKHLRHISRPGDYFVSLDLTDGYYTLVGIRKQDREYLTVNYRGELWCLACLPMGWLGVAYYSCKLSQVFTNYLRRHASPAPSTTTPSKRPSRRLLLNIRLRGTRVLSYLDTFLFPADSYAAALLLRARVNARLLRLGLLRNTKGT